MNKALGPLHTLTFDPTMHSCIVFVITAGYMAVVARGYAIVYFLSHCLPKLAVYALIKYDRHLYTSMIVCKNQRFMQNHLTLYAQ